PAGRHAGARAGRVWPVADFLAERHGRARTLVQLHVDLVAGGGLACGKVVGSTDAKGQDVKDARVVRADLGATVFRHLGLDLEAQWTDAQGRPQPIVIGGGRPIPELTSPR